MKNKAYSVQGDPVGGHRIAVPEHTGVKKGDRYMFSYFDVKDQVTITVPPGTLVYIPEVKK